jgi:hypothetical protein
MANTNSNLNSNNANMNAAHGGGDNDFSSSFNSLTSKDYNFVGGNYQRESNKRGNYDRKASGTSRRIHTPPPPPPPPPPPQQQPQSFGHHSKKSSNSNHHSNFHHPIQPHHQPNPMLPYGTNMNEMLMKEMAQKMFASVYSQIQSQQQQQQQQQQQKQHQHQHQPLINAAHMGSQMRHKF